ncbi:hypothetical protein WJX75_006865 [Coccomyxa subellipsoidea]|uniref:Uncharacterized protein n=1 Tax=Coccomyxa subellipsoidea TaxID=248742 RepID=A0ABR2YCE2_9CHLO
MWTGLSQFTIALKEQAESVVRESGLDGQLEQARKAAAGLLLDVPEAEVIEDHDNYQGSPHAPVSHFAGYAPPTPPPGSDTETEQHERERGAVPWHGLDSGGFSDVPLGSPPQRTSQPLPPSNGVKPRLEQVAQSLSHLGGTSSAGSEIGPRQHELQAENAGLKERLRAIENEAVEVLGELEEIKDRLAASEALRAAAERRADDGAARCSSLEAEAQHSQSLAQTVQAREREARANAEAAALARNQLEVAQEAFEKRLAESEAARQALTRQLEDLQQLSLPSPVKQVAAEEEAAEGGAAAAGDVKDLKAKLAKIKRQAITFKSKFTDAAATRDAALAELEALKQGQGGAQPGIAASDETEAFNRQLELSQLGLAQEALTSAATSTQLDFQNGDGSHAAAEGNGSVADAGAMQSNPLFSPAKGAATGAEEATPSKSRPPRGKAAAAKRVAELQGSLREKAQDLERVTNELAAAQSALTERSAEAENLAAELAAASEKLQAVSASGEQALAELAAQLAAAQKEAGSRAAAGNGVAEEVAALKAAATAASRERDSLAVQLAAAQQEANLTVANGDSDATAAPDHAQVEGLQLKMEEADARAAQFMERVKEQQKLLEASQARVQALEEALSESRAQVAAESAAAATARSETEAASRELDQAREGLSRLQEALQQARAAGADAEKSNDELQAQLAAAQDNVGRLQEALRQKEGELEAVRGGASVESNLASTAVKQANQRAEQAQQAAARANERATQAEQQLGKAAASAEAELSAADSRRREAESQKDQLQGQLEQAMAEAQTLTEALEAERSAAAADVASLQHRLEQESAAACSHLRQEMESQWQARLQEHTVRSDALLAERSSALERAEAEVVRLEKALAEAGTAAQLLNETSAHTEYLERELAATRKQLVEATGGLDSLRQEAEEAQAAARERQKKFSMLNATFRKKEEGLLARVEDAESAASQLREDALAAQRHATLAQQEAQRLAAQAEEHAARLTAAEAACAAAERGREDAQMAAAEAAAQLVAAQTQLAAARAAQSEAAADTASFEDRVQAAVTVREEEAAQRVREAEGAKAEAQARVTQAEARTAAAEAAKIELSLKLAEALSQQEDAADVSAVPTPVAPRPTGTSEEWAARYEELELAARVATRRAAAAEAELHRVKQQLEATDKRAKELAWQIKMISDPRQIGGQQTAGAVPPGVASSVLDMFGCGANYRR